MTELLIPVNCLYFSELHTHGVMPSCSTDLIHPWLKIINNVTGFVVAKFLTVNFA